MHMLNTQCHMQLHPIVKDDLLQVKLAAVKQLGVTDFTQICPNF